MTGKKVLLSVGTSKGLFLYTSRDRQRWELNGPFRWEAMEVNHAVFDARNGILFATANSPWFGSRIIWSRDFGANWDSAVESPKFSPESGLKLERIWHIAPGPRSSPEVMYAGVAPAALFRSEDCGQSWQEMTGLTSHPSRPQWQPGAGGLCLHSIVQDSTNDQRLWVGISAVGVFRTDDGGASWRPLNKGVRAEFMPQRYPEYGQCVHKLLPSPDNPSLLFQQNHCGVYRSQDAGESWEEVTGDLPSDFGFSLGVHPKETGTIYVVPLQPDGRCPPDGRLRVYRGRNGGMDWEPLGQGLPQENAFMGTYREAMTTDGLEPAGVYFGTNTGKLFYSADAGERWQLLADNLPPIYSVSAASLD